MDQKFTDEQMALILKRAAERQALSGEPTHSLESIQEIARQVGIDPRLVADAAATIDTSRSRPLSGAPSAYRMSRRLAETPYAIDQATFLATIRDHLPVAGEARTVGDGIEWHAGPADNKTVVSLSPSEHGTLLRIDARQHGAKAMAYLGGGLVGVFAGVVGAALWGAPGAAVGMVGLGASLAAARALWNAHATRRDQRLHALSDALAEQLESSEGAANELRGRDERGSDV
jgi:hypothetical protein